jgi:hypothetical protein
MVCGLSVIRRLFLGFQTRVWYRLVSANIRWGPVTIVFIGDIHQQWDKVARGLERLAEPPAAAVILGDVQCDRPLDVLAAPLLDRGIAVHWIFGNHDNDGGPGMWDSLTCPEEPRHGGGRAAWQGDGGAGRADRRSGGHVPAQGVAAAGGAQVASPNRTGGRRQADGQRLAGGSYRGDGPLAVDDGDLAGGL